MTNPRFRTPLLQRANPTQRGAGAPLAYRLADIAADRRRAPRRLRQKPAHVGACAAPAGSDAFPALRDTAEPR